MTTLKTSKLLVLGATGMLGSAVLRFFAESEGYSVVGSARSASALQQLPSALRELVHCGVDVENADNLQRLFAAVRPDVVVNCIGLVKQLTGADDPLAALPINSLLPHRLARLCNLIGARLIHVSTDCVFNGNKGMYRESDPADADDLYGRSKYLGEVDYPHAVTLRTSIIGHEMGAPHGLLGWFLAQSGSVKGYTRAVFSGLPTVELARVIRDVVVLHRDLHGVHHVAAAPIAKFELLRLIAQIYDRNIDIIPDDRLVVDRSLDAAQFRRLTGYAPPGWPELIVRMKRFG